MRLFHERSFPRSAPLCKSDEEECFTPVGRRLGVWLTTEATDRPDALEMRAAESAVEPYEVTAPGDAARTFVVPFGVLIEIGAAPS